MPVALRQGLAFMDQFTDKAAAKTEAPDQALVLKVELPEMPKAGSTGGAISQAAKLATTESILELKSQPDHPALNKLEITENIPAIKDVQIPKFNAETSSSDKKAIDLKVSLSPGHLAYTGGFMGVLTGSGLRGRGQKIATYAAAGYGIGCLTGKAYNYYTGTNDIALDEKSSFIGAATASGGSLRTAQLIADRVAINRNFLVQDKQTRLLSVAEDAPSLFKGLGTFSPIKEATNSTAMKALELAQETRGTKALLADGLGNNALREHMRRFSQHDEKFESLLFKTVDLSYSSSLMRGVAGAAVVGGGTYYLDKGLSNAAGSCFGESSAITKTLEPSMVGSSLAATGFVVGRTGKEKAALATAGWVVGKIENYFSK